MSSRVAWRVAAVVAFAATAALAVALSRGASLDASFVSAHHQVPAARGVRAAHEAFGARCATSRLRVQVTGRGQAAGYAVEFTNVSGAACTLSGYPSVAAYGASGGQVGNPAGRGMKAAAARVVLSPGASADVPVVIGVAVFRAPRCRPVTAVGLYIVPPGGTDGWYVRRAVRACSAMGPRAPVFLRVLAVRPAPGSALP